MFWCDLNGCGNTSVIFGMGKAKFIIAYMKNDTHIKPVVLSKEKSESNVIVDSEECFFIYLYGVIKPIYISLNKLPCKKCAQCPIS